MVTKGPNKNDAFDQSRLYLQNNPNIAVDKIAILFPETASINLNEVSRSISFNPFKRTVSARINLTTNPDYADESDNILKRNVSISDKKQVNRDAVIPILGDKQFIIKNQNKKVGNRSVSVNMVSDKNSLVEDSILLASGHAPEADYKYLTSKTTIENPLQNSVSSKLDFTFFD